MAIISIIAVAFLGGLATASRSAALADIRTNAESLARTHLEHAKRQLYSVAPWDYEISDSGAGSPSEQFPDWWNTNPPPSLSDEHAGYTVLVEAEPLPDDIEGIQEIAVTVFHHSREEAVIVLANYKVDR